MKFILVLAFCISFVAKGAELPSVFHNKYKESCSKYVNLMSESWGHTSKVPNLDQGPVGICYSHAATTLIDLWRDLHGLKLTKQMAYSNPQYAALLYKMTDKETNTLDSGSAQVTIDEVRKYGMCRFDVIEQSMNSFALNKKISTRDWYAITEWFFESYNSKLQKEIVDAPNKAEKLKEIFLRFNKKDRVKNIFDNGDFQKIYESMEPYLLSKDYKAYARDVFSACFKKENIYLPTLRLPPLVSIYQNLKLTDYLIEQLDRKNPVGITYKASVLTSDDKFLKRIELFFSDSDHQSVIVGKRVRDNQCQFLLKNSWGNYCGYKWECQKNSKGEEVGVWVDGRALIMASKDIFYFNLNAKR